VIVGASLAGAKATQTLREEGFTGRIVLIGEEAERPYERPPLSKGYLLSKGTSRGSTSTTKAGTGRTPLSCGWARE
jgi:3-phenylpropionate/trans-cinnamate dioxygenase ferredoxin reductase subunit